MNSKPSSGKHTHLVAIAAATALGSSYFSSPVIAAAADDDPLAEVTVTGSRIARRDNEASSPIVTVSQEVITQTSNLGLESALNQLPQFVPAQTQFSSGDIQSLAYNTPGIASLNLRGLGANRNLVLIDGRRAQPANALLVVDINTIPSAAVENIEIISGGASATYGADAMGGVTNFKLKHNFEGFNLNVQRSITEQGGGAETKISGLIGGSFGEGGNVMLGIEGAKRDEILTVDRDFYLRGYLDPGTPSGTSSLRFASYKPTAGNAPGGTCDLRADGAVRRGRGFVLRQSRQDDTVSELSCLRRHGLHRAAEHGVQDHQRRDRGRRTQREQSRGANLVSPAAVLALRPGRLRLRQQARGLHAGQLHPLHRHDQRGLLAGAVAMECDDSARRSRPARAAECPARFAT